MKQHLFILHASNIWTTCNFILNKTFVKCPHWCYFFYIMRIRQYCVVISSCRRVLCCYGNCVFRTWVTLIANTLQQFLQLWIRHHLMKDERRSADNEMVFRGPVSCVGGDGHTLLKSTEEHWRRTAALTLILNLSRRRRRDMSFPSSRPGHMNADRVH